MRQRPQIRFILIECPAVERRLCHDHIVVHTHIHFKVELLPPASPNALRRQAAFKERISNPEDRHIEGIVRPIGNIILGAVHLATNDVYSRSSSPANVNHHPVTCIANAAEALQLDEIPFAETWDPLLSQVKQFTDLVQKISEVYILFIERIVFANIFCRSTPT